MKRYYDAAAACEVINHDKERLLYIKKMAIKAPIYIAP